MKRIKTWKRWVSLNRYGEPFLTMSDEPEASHEKPHRLIAEPDYRKVMAVYNAAMKWHALPAGASTFAVMVSLEDACERARK